MPNPTTPAGEEVHFDASAHLLYLTPTLRLTPWRTGLIIERWDPTLSSWTPEPDDDPGTAFPLAIAKPCHPTPIDEFISDIRIRVRRVLRRFTWRQLVLLRIVRHHPPTIDFIRANPLLALLLADAMAIQGIPANEACSWMSISNRRILTLCGYPNSNDVIRILDRITATEYSQRLCSHVKYLLGDGIGLRRLRGSETIPAHLIPIYKYHPDFTCWALSKGSRVWRELRDFGKMYDGHHCWASMIDIAESHMISAYKEKMAACQSLRALSRLRDDWRRSIGDTDPLLLQGRRR